MPKKRNFLGGMQNYNPNNGEYESALVGPNGKVAKDVDGDGKEHEATKKSYDPRENGNDNSSESSQLIEQIKKNTNYEELKKKFKDNTLSDEDEAEFEELDARVEAFDEISKSNNEIEAANKIIKQSNETIKSLRQKIDNKEATENEQLNYSKAIYRKQAAETVIENLSQDGSGKQILNKTNKDNKQKFSKFSKIDEEEKPYFESAKAIDSLWKKAKSSNLSFERMLLNDIKQNPENYNKIVLNDKEYIRKGNSFDVYRNQKLLYSGTFNSVASDINQEYLDVESKMDNSFSNINKKRMGLPF